MAIDRLIEKIRKLKNPCVVDFTADMSCLPAHLLQQEHDRVHAYGRFCTELMGALQGIVPAVRYSFSGFALMGTEGLTVLARLLSMAKSMGYYVFLDVPESLSALSASMSAQAIFAPESLWVCDGIISGAYIVTDALKPFVEQINNSDKDLFVVVRTSNKTAAQMQDLLTGGRLAYMAMADQINRLGAPVVGKCGYSRIAAVGAASSADCLRNLRSKYKSLFLLLDGSDYPNANAKNCSFAFDALGHGAVLCAGLSITAAWKDEEDDGAEYTRNAVEAAKRLQKNIARYVKIM